MRPLRDIEKLLIGFFTIFAIVGCTVFIVVCARSTPVPRPTYVVRDGVHILPAKSMWGLYLGMNAEKFDANANGLAFERMQRHGSSPVYVCRIRNDAENLLKVEFAETKTGEFVLCRIAICGHDDPYRDDWDVNPETYAEIPPYILHDIYEDEKELIPVKAAPSLKGLYLGMTAAEFEAADLDWDVTYTFSTDTPDEGMMYLECQQKADETVSLILAFQQDETDVRKHYRLNNIEQGRLRMSADEFKSSGIKDGLKYNGYGGGGGFF